MGLTDNGQRNSPEDHARRVREMFAKISPRYDLLNHLLSANVDVRWRRRVVRKIAPRLAPDAQVLDVGCGTGDLSIEIFEKTAAPVVGLDFCRPMLELASEKAPHLRFIEGDALKLPFGDCRFDCITIGFALRNLSSVEKGLAELRRVLKPKGTLAILEFSQPTIPIFRELVRFYYWGLLPWIGGGFSGSRSAYEYLPDSIGRFPNQKALAEMMRAAGFEDVEFENLSGGVAALHTGRRA
jgi:demethylmenaquinone methyltransferase / 2-methoxy-6-polyprenyl-1,4-benzoquinol methylase